MNKLNTVLSFILLSLVVYLLLEVREIKNEPSGVGRYQRSNASSPLIALDTKEGKLVVLDKPIIEEK